MGREPSSRCHAAWLAAVCNEPQGEFNKSRSKRKDVLVVSG